MFEALTDGSDRLMPVLFVAARGIAILPVLSRMGFLVCAVASLTAGHANLPQAVLVLRLRARSVVPERTQGA